MAEIQAQALVMDVNNDGEIEIVAGVMPFGPEFVALDLYKQ